MERITKHEQDGTVNFETCKPWSKSGGPGTKNNAGGPATQVVHVMCVTVSGCSFFLSSSWGYNDCPLSCRALARWFCAPRLCPETLGNDPLSSTRLRSIPRTRSGCLTGHTSVAIHEQGDQIRRVPCQRPGGSSTCVYSDHRGVQRQSGARSELRCKGSSADRHSQLLCVLGTSRRLRGIEDRCRMMWIFSGRWEWRTRTGQTARRKKRQTR